MTNAKSSIRIVFRDKFRNNFDGGFLLKSTMNVKAISWLAGGNPRGCNVGIILDDGAVAKATALLHIK